MDSPSMEQFIKAIQRWQKMALPEALEKQLDTSGTEDFPELSRLLSQKLGPIRNSRAKAQLEKSIVGWLYAFIRLNIKRGRIFDLREVLTTGLADCLGYAKLFVVLGRYCGLNSGVVEVVIDNGGRIVPHTTSLVRLSGGQRQFIDFWYGSMNIKHRRFGLRVKQDIKWTMGDVDYGSLNYFKDVSYLPDDCVDAITLYVEGNRFLKVKNYTSAVERYSQAILRYPQNTRLHYNRALAYDNLGRRKEAGKDYARALGDDAAVIRALATQSGEIVELLRLDEEKIPESAQQVYLLSRGFITGRRVSTKQIARKTGLSPVEVSDILDSVTGRQ